jgi:P3 major capsid protein
MVPPTDGLNPSESDNLTMPTAAAPVTASSTPQMSPEQINAAQRKYVLAQSVMMKQQVAAGTVNPANGNVINIVPRNVGLILRFIVQATATFADAAAGTLTTTNYGALNIFSNIQFTDLQNNQRHNTYGLHFGLVSSFKERQPFVGANTVAQSQGAFGANWTLVSATPPTTGATGSATCVLEIPLAYSDEDLRGSIYANVVANQMQLQLTINNNAAPAAGDDTFAVFYGAAGGDTSSISSLTYTIYQLYLDQLPIGQGGVVLPVIDISTVYQLLYSNFTNIAQGQDYYIQYTNFRRYLSMLGIYNSTGTVGGRLVGSDINFFAQVSANFTNIFKNNAAEQARLARRLLRDDPPIGTYYFGSTAKPIYTLTYGNMQIDINPSIAGASAYFLALWEFMAIQNTLSSAGSLPANG